MTPVQSEENCNKKFSSFWVYLLIMWSIEHVLFLSSAADLAHSLEIVMMSEIFFLALEKFHKYKTCMAGKGSQSTSPGLNQLIPSSTRRQIVYCVLRVKVSNVLVFTPC